MNVLEKLKNIRSANPQLGIWSTVARSKIAQISVATVIIIAICLFFTPQEQTGEIKTQQIAQTAKSPAEMLTAVSLNIAYRKGGIEAVEKQCEEAFNTMGYRPRKVSIQELMVEFNGV